MDLRAKKPMTVTGGERGQETSHPEMISNQLLLTMVMGLVMVD